MTRCMFGPLILLAASVSPPAQPVSPVAERIASPVIGRATANATVSIRIISGVSFGEGKLAGAEWADRRKAQLADASGLVHPAELLEFQ